MWFKPRFLRQTLPLIHEDKSQHIQGGLPGEHYHLSAELYAALIKQISNPSYLESVSVDSGELAFVNSGDVITVLIETQPGSGTGATIPPELVPPVVPDIVTPPVVVPPVLGPVDSLWDYVVAMTNMNSLTVGGAATSLDQYGSQIGTDPTKVVASNTYPLYGNNTLKLLDPTDASPLGMSVTIIPRQYNATVYFPDDFCMEFKAAKQQKHGNRFFIFTRRHTPNNFDLLALELLDNGTGTCGIYNNGGWSADLSQIVTFVKAWNVLQFYDFCIERVGDTVTFYIDGVSVGSIVNTAVFGELDVFAQIWGPLRVTSRSRYNGNHTPVNGVYLKG